MPGPINEWGEWGVDEVARTDKASARLLQHMIACPSVWSIRDMICTNPNATRYPPSNVLGVFDRVALCLCHRADVWRAVHASWVIEFGIFASRNSSNDLNLTPSFRLISPE